MTVRTTVKVIANSKQTSDTVALKVIAAEQVRAKISMITATMI
ncbi:hypothetical protein ACW180_07495 [Limosilactobacillus fermentum]